MTDSNQLLEILDIEVSKLEQIRSITQVKRVSLAVINLLTRQENLDDLQKYQLFSDKGGKIRANSSWFFEDDVVIDRKAVYSIKLSKDLPIDFRLYGISSPNKRLISWVQALTPNFEDEPFNQNFNIGIDFVAPKSLDKVIVVLSNNYSVRTLELSKSLSNTDKQIFTQWTQIQDFSRKAEVHNILWTTLDIQPINKKFYVEIFTNFALLKQHLYSNNILNEYRASLFANKLIGRIIFCWFINKKGLIDTQFEYFDSAKYADDNDYYREKLEVLFFDVLNTPNDNRRNKDTVTPYLNGGLFQISKDDLYHNSRLTFPINFFDNLYNFLSSFNFTTDESSSSFQQVAIDPEMLGRIFENLLAEINSETGEQIRKSKGAFYTPREVVDFMCKNSLLEYLKSKIPKDEFRDRRLFQLIEATDAEFQDQDHNWRRDWKPYKEKILTALDELRVLDPACGSGAFPIGMMQTLLRVYERLEPRFDPYKSKLEILQKNIFGVDIDPMAIEISRLRAWLSLIVDGTDIPKQVKPLPNLDFKFICTNALLTLEHPAQAFLGEDPEIGSKLQEIREKYFNTESLSRKDKLRKEYNLLITSELSMFGETKRTEQLKSFRPFTADSVANFFDAFEMFGLHEFEIVIGNPPYLGQSGHKHIFDEIKNSRLSKFKDLKMDLFYYFFHLGLNLLKHDGILCFITTNYFPTATGGFKLRQDLYERSSILKMINFGEFKIFKSALGQHNMITLLVKNPKNNLPTEMIWVNQNIKDEKIDIVDILKKNPSYVGFETLEKDKVFDTKNKYYIRFPYLDFNRGHDFTNTLERISASKYLLKDLFNVNQGLITGANKFTANHKKKFAEIDAPIGSSIFVIKKSELQKFKSSKNVRPWYKNSDIKRWKVEEDPDEFVLYIDQNASISETEIEHLSKFKKILLDSSTEVDNVDWCRLHRSRNKDIFLKPKLVCPQRSHLNTFAYTEKEWFAASDVYFITQKSNSYDLLTLLALLNSTPYYIWFYFNGKKKGEMLELFKNPLDEVPIPKLNKETADQLGRLAESAILAVKSLDHNKITEIENVIDDLVLYTLGIEKMEIEQMRKFRDEKSGS